MNIPLQIKHRRCGTVATLERGELAGLSHAYCAACGGHWRLQTWRWPNGQAVQPALAVVASDEREAA